MVENGEFQLLVQKPGTLMVWEKYSYLKKRKKAYKLATFNAKKDAYRLIRGFVGVRKITGMVFELEKPIY